MSIFGGFTDRMSNIFRIVQCGYRNCDREFTTRSKMLGSPFRDPSSYPLARGRVLPPDLRTDYVLNERQFECFVGEKRKWVTYNQLFDIDIHCINDFMVLVALGGDFDKSLPMTDQDKEESEETEVRPDPLFWTNVPPTPDYSKYWNIVSSHIEQNILSHVRPECGVGVRCVPTGCSYGAKSQTFRIELYVNLINGEQCYWFDINNILQKFGGRSRMDELSVPPTIIFKLLISKDE